MTIDFDGILRKRKPARRRSQLIPRALSALLGPAALPKAPRVLILDANVYIDHAADRLPPHVYDVIDQALLFHCSVVLAELAVGVANADPSRPGWPAMRDHYSALFASIPASRVVTPDAQVWADAGVIAGMLARTQRFQKHQRHEYLNDALIYLTAAKAGIPVLTANREDFDLIQQIAPEGQFIYV